ncbi:MAG: histidine kinase [Amaricoccus sp.]|uniref:sensor histidine kinase n=1 Tax=Amaricoccus sp. TaxID=1872485 RepID=UPI0039E71FCF
MVIFTTSELFGWSCLFLALQYNARARETERQLAAAREEGLKAQMRALQYQVNPHFLFNTLNSIAGLIEEDSREPAQEMTLRLAGFLRQTLALDPAVDVRLAEEIALQTDYLAIEETRFSDRLEVRLSLPGGVPEARVPALILQPLVENAIKHGVARTPGHAVLEIGADRVGDELRLWVESPAAASKGPGAGLGVGLANVTARLAARWPGRSGCASSAAGPGRVRVEMRMPFVA